MAPAISAGFLRRPTWIRTPWDDPERYAFHSPITYVKNIKTPLLIFHSEQDLRCPIEQAEQLWTALKWLRREVEFLRFERQSHGLSRFGHPKLRVERLAAIADWFTDHLLSRSEGTNGHEGQQADVFTQEDAVGAPSPVDS